MSNYIANIQYNGRMSYRHGYHGLCHAAAKSRFEKWCDREDMLREVSKLPPSERRAALRRMERECRERGQ